MADSGEGQVGRFHPKCSSGIELSEDRKIASGKGYDSCYVFSNDPIPIGLQFSLKILQKDRIMVSPFSVSSRPHPSATCTLHGWRCCACSPLLPMLCIL